MAELVASDLDLTQSGSAELMDPKCDLPALPALPQYEYLNERDEHYDCSGCESSSNDDDSSDDSGGEGIGACGDGATDGRRAPIDFNGVTYMRKDIRRRQRRDAAYKEWLASRSAGLEQLPLKQLLGFYRKPDHGGAFGHVACDIPLWCLWCDMLLPAPQVPAKEQVLTPMQRDTLLCEAKHVVARMKETRRLHNGARILAAKAPYSLEYVAAALALLCGWFAKGNRTPNLTVAASKLRAPDAPPLHTRATARIKAWMVRLKELDGAMKAEWQTQYHLRTAQDEAEALEVLRRGIGPRTVIPATGSAVCGEGLFRMLLRTAVHSGKLGSLVREPCSYPVCSGTCEGARKRPTNMAMRYRCACSSQEADAASQNSSAEQNSDAAAYIARAFADVSVS